MYRNWIKIKDKLPRQGLEVMIYAKRFDVIVFEIARRWGKKNDWHFTSADYRFDDSEVTHWMPMPKRPKR